MNGVAVETRQIAAIRMPIERDLSDTRRRYRRFLGIGMIRCFRSGPSSQNAVP
jgi:hypothetical protein